MTTQAGEVKKYFWDDDDTGLRIPITIALFFILNYWVGPLLFRKTITMATGQGIHDIYNKAWNYTYFFLKPRGFPLLSRILHHWISGIYLQILT